MAAYPDALVIQTHREPRTIIASSSSLSAHASAGQSTVFQGEVIGRGPARAVVARRVDVRP